MNFLKWLYPGLKIKRWFVLSLSGFVFIGTGLAIAGDTSLFGRLEQLVRADALFFGSNSLVIGVLVALAGLVLVLWGFNRMLSSVLNVMLPEQSKDLINVLYQKHQLRRGPKIVAIGGGTGLATLLRGLKNYTSNITAVVTVTDNGGSSGRLRGELGILPPGDIRNCLIALADSETLMQKLLDYRFSQGTGLAGHTVGNLILAGLSEMSGNLNNAVREISRVLAVRGQVLPATLDDVQLCAKMKDKKIVCGETDIVAYPLGIEEVFLQPQQCQPLREALEAIADADAIILGPGSLYTSVIPNLLVGDLAEKLRSSHCPVYYVVNVMTQPGETDGYLASHHLKALLDHGARVDYLVASSSGFTAKIRRIYSEQAAYPVRVDDKTIKDMGVKIIRGRLTEESDLARHDADSLARLIMEHLLNRQSFREKMRRQLLNADFHK